LEKGLIVTYLLTYGGALVSLFNPFIGLLIYVCFAIIRPESMWHWSVPAGNYSRIVAIALLAGWAIHGFGNWRWGKGALSATQAPDSERSWAFLESLGKIILPFVVGMTLITSVAQLKQLAWVIVLSQGYVALELNLAYFDGFNRLQFDGFGGMDNNCVAIAMVTGVGMAFFLGLYSPKWWQQGLAYFAAALMAHSIFFSFSRGGMLSLILTGAVSLTLIKLQPKHYAVLALAALLGMRMAGPEVQERFLTVFTDSETRDSSAQSRLELWEDCADATAKRPVFGLGPAHWPLVAEEYGWPAGKEAHSLWMQIMAELGIPGLSFLLGFYLLTMARLWPLVRRPAGDAWLQLGAAMIFAGLFGFMISAQFVSLVGLELPYYATMLGAGVLKLAADGRSPGSFCDQDTGHHGSRPLPEPDHQS
jgi:putative inorganic carbon (hco3(-)) transporter